MKRVHKYLYIFLILFQIGSVFAQEQDTVSQSSSILSEPSASFTDYFKDDTLSNKSRIMLANVKYYKGIDEHVTDFKVDAALNLAAKFSKKYVLVPLKVRDSVAAEMRDSAKKPTVLNVAKNLDVDELLFVLVNKLQNMVRVEITIKSVEDTTKESAGVGYSLLHYMKLQDDKPLYDPTLLEAIQRAFARAEGDTMMFADAPGSFRVLPAKTLVIGGLMYRDDKSLDEWELFDTKEISSYDAAEAMFDAARESEKYAVYDIPSRDTLYTLFNLYGVENFNAPSSYEIMALSEMDVQRYITGVFERVKKGAEIKLYLCDFKNKSLDILKTAEGSISEDDIDEMRLEVKRLTRKLLGI